MAKRNLPEDVDMLFLIGAIMIFLMINYSMPLATIYTSIVLLAIAMYLVPIQFNLFKWIPIAKKDGNLLMKVGIGALFGLGFIWFYNQYAETPMAAVFATTIFGQSEILTKVVYSGLIPPIESLFFFVYILVWWAWKIGDNVHTMEVFSADGIKLMIMFGAVFVLFHATAKGVENTVDLALTFAFGALSVGMILHFKEAIQAIMMHVVVNAKAMEVIPSLAAVGSSSLLYVGIAGIAAYYFLIKPNRRPTLI